MRALLILDLDMDEVSNIDSGSIYEFVRDIQELDSAFKVVSAHYKYESGYEPNVLTPVV